MKRSGAIILLALVASAAGAAGAYFLLNRRDTTTVVETRTTVSQRPAAKQATPPVPDKWRGTTSCYAYSRGSGLAINFVATDAGRACWDTIQSRAQAGEYWSMAVGPPTSVGTTQAPYCTMRAPQGGQALVYDTGGADGGQAVCARLQARGWTDQG